MDLIIKITAFAPLASFAIIGALNRKASKSFSAWLACAGVFVSFLCATCIFYDQVVNPHVAVVHVYDWISSGTFTASFDFLVDRLTAVFLMFITGVGFLIHLFSVSYMKDDDGIRRFFAYLNLFMFFMLVLVLADSFLITFIGWEGVGFCSFMLISFWHKDMKNNDAAKKAFVMNRIGDFGYLMAMCLIFVSVGSLQYSELFLGEKLPAIQALAPGLATLICGCLFLGAAGKSAQIPLFTWLPDAMAAPTPVSALIHAATMVTAGVYLVARTHVLFEMSWEMSQVVTWIGIATALLGAVIGLMQTDIKKVLAYSTVSQLGLMFVALGIGAYTAAIFHVLTHAFFKALLFLGSGSVIHAMGGEQDIRRMGGLRKKLPITYVTFFIGTIAISGIPPLAGFFSKDQILAAALHENLPVFMLAFGVSMLTAFYMFRLLFLTFFGVFRGTEEQKHHLHESPILMTAPLVILAILSAVGGWIGIPHGIAHALGIHKGFDTFLHPVLGTFEMPVHLGEELALITTTTLLILAAIYYAYRLFVIKKMSPAQSPEEHSGIGRLVAGRFFVDEAYSHFIVRNNDRFSSFLQRFIERGIDGAVNTTGSLVGFFSHILRRAQTGLLEDYAMVFVLAVAAMVAVLLYEI